MRDIGREYERYQEKNRERESMCQRKIETRKRRKKSEREYV